MFENGITKKTIFKNLLKKTHLFNEEIINEIAKNKSNSSYYLGNDLNLNIKLLNEILAYDNSNGEYNLIFDRVSPSYVKYNYDYYTISERFSLFKNLSEELQVVASRLFTITHDTDLSLTEIEFNLGNRQLYRENPNMILLRQLLFHYNKELEDDSLLEQNIIFLTDLFKYDTDRSINYNCIEFSKNRKDISEIDTCNLNQTSYQNQELFKHLPNVSTTLSNYLINSEELSQDEIDKIGKIIKENIITLRFSSDEVSYHHIDTYINDKIQNFILLSGITKGNSKEELKKLNKFMKKYRKIIKKANSIGLTEEEVSTKIYQYINESKTDKK